MKSILKTILLFVFAISVGTAVNAQSAQATFEAAPAKDAQGPKFKWGETTHDFGKIPKDNPVTYDFTFTNTGTAPIIISKVQGSCGCTVTSYTEEPVAPGKKGFVKAVFNAAAMGAFNKSISVTANVEGGTERLFIKGEVVNE